jgi:glycosyltransferase involved in cell wall biosynthesis
MAGEMRVLSVYEGFFSGGARALHSSVVAGLHEGGRQAHSVLSIHREMLRETLRQRMHNDSSYRLLRRSGVPVASLGRTFADGVSQPFTDLELTVAARRVGRSDMLLSLKEQPLRLINHEAMPQTPVIACLHRSDPENQGSALSSLRDAAAGGRLAAVVCCAESTRAAYLSAGIPSRLLHVIPNGVDLERFRPAPSRARAQLRHAMRLPAEAPVVVFAARYDGMKNVPLFLAAARQFLGAAPDGRVLMCGAGMRRANAELAAAISAAFADNPRLARRLHLFGVRRDMEQIYRASDVVALTSIVGEAAPLCLIEGMMCGAVPVATDVGDCARIVSGHGLLVGWQAAEIGAAWTEAARRRCEFAPTLQRSRTRFSRARMVASYSALIDRVWRDTRTARRVEKV